MQCLSPKSTEFNEFSSNIATVLVCLATNMVYNFLKMIFDGMVRKVNNQVSKFLIYPRFLSKCLKMGQFGQITHTHTYVVPFHTRKFFTTLRVNSLSFSGRTVPLFPSMLVTMGEGSGTPTEPHHTPTPEATPSPQHKLSSSSLPPAITEPLPTLKASVKLLEDREGGGIAQCGEDAPIKRRSLDKGEEADVERSTERASDDTEEMVTVITSLDAASILTSGVSVSISPVTKIPVAEVPTGSGSIPTASPPGTGVPTGSGMVPTASPIFTTAIESTPYTRRKGKEKMVESDTPKKKKKLQEQIDVQVKEYQEKDKIGSKPDKNKKRGEAGKSQKSSSKLARDQTSNPTSSENPTLKGQIRRSSKQKVENSYFEVHLTPVAMMTDNRTMAEMLRAPTKGCAEAIIDKENQEKDKIGSKPDKKGSVVKEYQEKNKIRSKPDKNGKHGKAGKNSAKKTSLKEQQRDFYMSVLRSHAGWKAKHFKGMTLEEGKEKFDPVWKQMQDFIPMGSKEEGERFKRKGLRLEKDSAKKVKTSEEVPEEKLKEMMQLIPVEEVYVEALQVKHPIIDWEVYTEGQRSYWKIMRLGGSSTSYQFFVDLLKHLDREDLNQLWALVKETLNIRPAANDMEKELWVELKRLYEPDVEELLWTHTHNLMHALVEWKLYNTCGVYHVISKDQEMFVLVEKDYPLRKGLAIVMISYKLQVENYS
uniref:Uncharacterized protein n=1 Tax=Tanacetum cinerariifolium TaxID=118510 RepID=A0A6L2JTR0_TANCI|nr:hypothetical protein [Tanacetum cinerariifolium]